MNCVSLENASLRLDFDPATGALVGLTVIETGSEILNRSRLGLSLKKTITAQVTLAVGGSPAGYRLVDDPTWRATANGIVLPPCSAAVVIDCEDVNRWRRSIAHIHQVAGDLSRIPGTPPGDIASGIGHALHPLMWQNFLAGLKE